MKNTKTSQVAVTKQQPAILGKKDVQSIHTSLDKRILAANGVKVDANTYQLQASEHEMVTIKVIDQKILVAGKNHKLSLSMAEKPDLKALLDIINNSYYIIKNEGSAKTTTNNKGVTTMETNKAQYSVNVPKFKASLLKNGWTEKKGVFTSKNDTSVAFTAKTVRLNRDGVSQTIVLATCTDAALVACIKSLDAGTQKVHTPIEGLTVPIQASPLKADKAQGDREQSGKQPEKSTAKVKKDADGNDIVDAPPATKEPPVKPANPNADGSHPIFDQLAVAVTTTDKVEGELISIWQPLADKYNFSVSGLIAELHKEGMWPDKKNKDGIPFEVDGFTVPAGYKGVYEAEKEQGLQGAGYMVNRASRMFTKLNPEMKPGQNKGKGAVPTNESETQSEKDVNKIFVEMSRLAKKLSKENLKAWLNADMSVLPILNEMLEPAMAENEVEDLLDGLA